MPSGSLGAYADGVTLCEGRAYLRTTYPRVVQPLDLVGSSWVPGAQIGTPDPALGSFAYRVCASGPLLVVSSGGPIVEHIGGTLSTYANDGSRATLRASTARMTLEDGGTLTLALDAGIANAGKLFFLGGSLSGTSPGTRVNGVRVPLNERNDPYYRLSLRRGNLDGLGRATVDVVLPAMAPGDALTFLKDRTLHHTFVIWEPQRGITHVANVELTALVGRTH